MNLTRSNINYYLYFIYIPYFFIIFYLRSIAFIVILLSFIRWMGAINIYIVFFIIPEFT
jgi:hypothetical protein